MPLDEQYYPTKDLLISQFLTISNLDLQHGCWAASQAQFSHYLHLNKVMSTFPIYKNLD